MARGKARLIGSTMIGGGGKGSGQSEPPMEYDADLLRKMFKPEE